MFHAGGSQGHRVFHAGGSQGHRVFHAGVSSPGGDSYQTFFSNDFYFSFVRLAGFQ